MTTLRLTSIFLTGACLWAQYQPTYSDNLTGVDSSKWTQTGSLSIGSHGVTGNGSLTAATATRA